MVSVHCPGSGCNICCREILEILDSLCSCAGQCDSYLAHNSQSQVVHNIIYIIYIALNTD